jgi:starch phosphorylase
MWQVLWPEQPVEAVPITHVLTIGFARRNATCKQIRLLIQDPARALGSLGGLYRIQLLLAGKAHPSDDEAKNVVQELYRFKDVPEFTEQVVFLHEHDLAMAARLVRGCDLWLNLPLPPARGVRK